MVGNAGTILAADHGGVSFCGVGVGNQDGGAIMATDDGTVAFKFGTVENDAGALIAAEGHGTVTFEDVNRDGGLNNLGTVEALGWGSQVSIERSTVTNCRHADRGRRDGLHRGPDFILSNVTVAATDGGTVFVGVGSTLNNVTVAISDGGIAEFADALSQGVTFTGAGTLELHQAPGDGAAMTGFRHERCARRPTYCWDVFR